MGFSLSWLAVKGKSSQAVLEELGFRSTGQHESIPESELTAVKMPNGWYLIVSQHTEQVVSDSLLRKLSASGCELVTCSVEEHVMVSKSSEWKDGRIYWVVSHDAQKGSQDLDYQGELPSDFNSIKDGLIAKKLPDCDYIFDIPVETARSVVGYRYDQDVPGLNGDVFEVLSCSSKKSSFFKRLFGST